MEESFRKVLEEHRSVPFEKTMVSIRDSSFAVLSRPLDGQFCAEMMSFLSKEPQSTKKKHNPSNLVQRQLTTAMKAFLSHQHSSSTAHRAITTASLSLLRNSCAVNVPSKLSMMAAHALLQALKSENNSSGAKPEVALGSEDFPESQMAAFLLDATRVGSPPPPSVPIAVSPEIAAKVIYAFGVGKPRDNRLEWGSEDVAEYLRGSVRRVADRFMQAGEWTLFSELIGHMKTPGGVVEAERVIGMELGEMIGEAMLGEQWEPARLLVSCAMNGAPRQTLARALIPAASEAEAYDVAMTLIKDNGLESEFTNTDELQRKARLKDKKRKLEAVVKKPGWKMAQSMLERGNRDEHELRLWLVDHLCALGNLHAAAELMDHFRLHGELPPLDPELVAASAREHAAAHLRLPIDESRILFIDSLEGVRHARKALRSPPLIAEEAGGGSGSGGRRRSGGIRCVGLDVENSLSTNKAALLQVATSTDVFLFDLDAICGHGNGDGYGNGNGWHRHEGRSRSNGNIELARAFDHTIGALFSDERIVKLGFSFHQDANHLRRTWPGVEGFRNISTLLEVGSLSEAVLRREVGSLSKTCEAWLGKPLDKTECTSKWHHRPLTAGQLRYAALDAHCLVGIFEEILLEGGGKLVKKGDGDPCPWWRHFSKNIDQSSQERSARR